MPINTRFFKYKSPLSFIPDLLILILFPLAVFRPNIIFNTYPGIYYMIICLLILLITLSIYIKLYTWRNLPLALFSFILFFLNIIQLALYTFAISVLFNMLYFNNYTPIYLDDLSVLSKYRYLFLSLISIFFIFAFIMIKALHYNFPYTSYFTVPYLKEEIRKILYTWNDGFIGVFCNQIIDLLYFSSRFRICFFTMHFILFYFIRLLSTILLFYCTFYHGDFRNLLYLTPIMFLIWLLSFFNYYFITFQEDAGNYICSLLFAKKPEKSVPFWGVLKVDPSQVSFELTEEAISKGFCNSDMYDLTKEWYIQAQLSAYFQVYFKLVIYLNYFILLLQLIIWFYITQMFFFPLSKKYVLCVNIIGLFKSLGKTATRPYATQAHRVLPKYQKNLSDLTDGVHKGNHPALVDPVVKNPDNPSEILYQGQPTHGKGSAENPSYPLHSCKDLQGNPRPQNFVPPTTVIYTPKHYYHPQPILDSQSFLNESEVKVNLAKNTPQEENT